MALSQEDLMEAKRVGNARYQDAMIDIRGNYTATTARKAMLELINSLPTTQRDKAMSLPAVAKAMEGLEA